jgi:hypothetical protein
MKRLVGSLSVLLLWSGTTGAAPAPFPKLLTLSQLERQLRERGVQLSDVKQTGPKTWAVTCPDCRAGCLVGGPFKRTVRVEAPDRLGAIKAFLQWSREQEQRRLRDLRAAGAIP